MKLTVVPKLLTHSWLISYQFGTPLLLRGIYANAQLSYIYNRITFWLHHVAKCIECCIMWSDNYNCDVKSRDMSEFTSRIIKISSMFIYNGRSALNTHLCMNLIAWISAWIPKYTIEGSSYTLLTPDLNLIVSLWELCMYDMPDTNWRISTMSALIAIWFLSLHGII